MSHPMVTIQQWLYSKLAADPTVAAAVGTRIIDTTNDDMASGQLVFPAVIFQYIQADDLRGVGTRIIWSTADYLVKVIGRGSSLVELEALATAVHAAINNGSGDGVVSCVRMSPVAYPEIDGLDRYQHIGGIYQIRVQ